MSAERVAAAMARGLGPNAVTVFATNAQGLRVVIVVSSPEVLDELRELGLVISEQAPQLRKAS
jgi:hypothetical protein